MKMQHPQLAVDPVRAAPQALRAEPEGVLPRLMRLVADSGMRERCAPAEVFVTRLGDQIDGPLWRVLDARGMARLARKAASCMLVPSAGDLVQLLVDDAACWIVAVLERRAEGTHATIDLGDADVQMRAGSLVFQAQRGITHQARELCSTSLQVRETTDEKTSLVRQSSIVQAGSMALHVDRHLGVHAQLATVSAEALLKLDGAQIHMG